MPEWSKSNKHSLREAPHTADFLCSATLDSNSALRVGPFEAVKSPMKDTENMKKKKWQEVDHKKDTLFTVWELKKRRQHVAMLGLSWELPGRADVSVLVAWWVGEGAAPLDGGVSTL